MGRSDGKRIRNEDNMYLLAPYIMKDRSDACNSVTIRLPYKPMKDYINRKRKEGYNMSYMGLFIAAYLRTVSQFPKLNRFVVNSRIYARNGVSVGMVVLRAEEAQASMGTLHLDVNDNIYEVMEKIDQFVETNRQEDSNLLDTVMRILRKVPFMVRPIVNILMKMDQWNIMPKVIVEASPFHETCVVTNLASIRTNHIYHHIYNFGTVGQIMAIGKMQDIAKPGKDGGVEFERVMPIGIVCDERIASGHYYAQCFQYIEKLIRHPELLEEKPEKVVVDDGI